MASTMRILFVCMGNICRSPAGENVMNHILKNEGYDDKIQCDSAGTTGYHVGNGPDHRMCTTLESRGIPTQGVSRKFVVSDYQAFDLILAMDSDNYRDILALAPDEASKKKVVMFCHYVKKYPDHDVPDPYYGGQDGFEYVLDLMLDGCQNILEELRQKLD
jgi:protein-tyrosine phosphatase